MLPYTTKKITANIPSLGSFVLMVMSRTPDRVEVYRVESDGMESWCGYLSEIPVWAGRGLLEQVAVGLRDVRWNNPDHHTLQTELDFAA